MRLGAAACALALCAVAAAELFTAIADVEYLLETHRSVIDNLAVYVQKEEQRLAALKKNLQHYKREHAAALEDMPNYLGNPINAFTLIKRLTRDLDSIEEGIKIGTEYIKNITMLDDVPYPSAEDLSGAAAALARLQRTYRLRADDLADGRINGVAYSTPMTASDCFEVCRALYTRRDYRGAREWAAAALRRLDADLQQEQQQLQQEQAVSRVDVMEYIAFSHYMLDEVEPALQWTERILQLEPQHERALGNVPHYRRMLQEERDGARRRGETGAAEEPEAPELSEYWAERREYERLCRGEARLPPAVEKDLYCYYQTGPAPLLRLARLRAELRHRRPDIRLYHGVLGDTEIEELKEMARARFQRAVVHDPKTGQLVPADYRISKSGWLKDAESPLVAAVSRRVAHITALDVGSAEELQVVNYGIGGHYEPHYDFARKREKAFLEYPGNRIETVLFYMSDVSQGGATVFPRLGVALAPQRGAAAVWSNLHRSGEGDLATRHAACPVLRGSKWVCNKWLHQGGQELLRPCTTEYQPEQDLAL